MTLLTRALKNILLLTQEFTYKLALYLSSPLTYTPEGWDTSIPAETDTGWDFTGVSCTEGEKWVKFRTAVTGVGPLGFSHEDTNPDATDDDIYHHNISISFGYVLARVAHQKSSLSILDYGGALGHYYQIGKALLPDLKLSYSCKELPRMAALGKELNPEVHWFTDDSCLKNSYDLILISGSLQYIQNWRQFLRDMAESSNEYLFLTRVPVVNTVASFVAIQQAYGTRMLHWQFNRTELQNAFADAGFSIVREFLAGDSPYIKHAPEQCDQRGWLLKKCPLRGHEGSV
jgi:putative methyltransferase (TIGR04325 family)